MKTKTILFIANFFLLFFTHAVQAQISKITASDREDRAEFGTAVALKNNFAAVSASRENIATGAVYIYKNEDKSTWSFFQKLSAFDGHEMAEYGGSLRFTENHLVVGSGRKDTEEHFRTGAIYVYEMSEKAPWELSKMLLASDYSEGALLAVNPTSLATGPNTIVAGAPGVNFGNGAVYVFETIDGEWAEIQKITSPEPEQFENFGIGVGIFNDVIIIGASGTNNGTGSAYIYHKNKTGEWEFLQKIIASDGIENFYFGNSVHISQSEIVVGAYAEGFGNGDIAAAYIFQKGISGQWEEIQKIESHPANEDTFFAWMCQIQNNEMLISSPHVYGEEDGKVILYTKNIDGLWEEKEQIIPNDNITHDFYGWSFDMNEDFIIVGSPRDDFDEEGENEMMDAGSAYIFSRAAELSVETHERDVLKVYPIPVTNVLHIETQEAFTSIRIFDITGKLLIEENSKSINVSKLKTGFYLLKINTITQGSYTKKFLKK